MDISIVIPVYNTKKFLKECFESIVEGFPKKGEILLVDNGSSDGSLEMCKEIAKEHSFVKVLKCEIPGASAAKNYGLRHAKGKYVWFIDSDDYVKKGSVSEILSRFVETNADVVTVGAKKVDEEGNEILGGILKPVGPEISEDWLSKFIRYGLGPWQVVAKRDFLVKNNLFYDEGMIHEDMAIISTYILYTQKISAIEEPVYYYRQRKGSVLHGQTWNEKELDIFKALDLLLLRFEKKNAYEKYKAELEYFYIWNLLDDAAREFVKFPEGKKQFKRIRQVMKSRFPKWRKNKYFVKCPIMVRARCLTAYRGVVW